MIRALIVDDEIHAREEMAALLSDIEDISVIGSCGNSIEALKLINKLRPQVLFLDIQMPVINGFELLNMVNQDIMPHVVFVTAFDQYSLKAFEEKTLDYLLKPVDSERLAKTIDKLRQAIGEKRPAKYTTEEILRIPCLLGNRVRLIGLAEVEFVSSTATGVHVTTMDGDYFTEITLKILEKRTKLLRCHKQYLINIDCLKEIVLLEGGMARIITRTGKTIPVSRRYLKLIRKTLLI